VIAVLCPTRDRPEKLRRLVQSILDTSVKVHVLAWIDDDQYNLYSSLPWAKKFSDPYDPTVRIHFHYGHRCSVVEAMNNLAQLHREFRVYGMMPDDAMMKTPGWDRWMLAKFDAFPNDVGVVSPHHNYGDYIDMPFLSRAWIDAIGYFAYPHMFHYAWTLATGLLGEATNIVYATKDEMTILHDHVDSPNMAHYEGDCAKFFNHFMFNHRRLIDSLRAAM